LASSTADRLVVGVDVGGTKTHALVCDVVGHVRGFGAAGGGNWEMAGLVGTRRVLHDSVERALAAAGAGRPDVAAAGYGIAGLDWPGDEPVLTRVIDTLALPGPRAVVNDAIIALRAGCRGPSGIVSSAGTGSVTAGRNRDGDTFRTMAIGYGERGSGGDLVDAALHAIALEYHGSGEPTALTPAILELVGLGTVPEFFEALSRHRLQLPRPLPRLVLETADRGDRIATGIAETSGVELADAVIGVARRLGMVDDDFELVRSGSIHLAGCDALDRRFAAVVGAALPGAVIVSLTAPPAIGAALLALEQLGPVAPEVHDRLAREATLARAALDAA
jgi:N-acetylglucosamine kinase-like BadF-type ATPase